MELRVFLLLIVGGVFASALVIVIVFIIVNMCIRRKVASYTATLTNHTKSSYEMNSSSNRFVAPEVRPPLPPRHQFDTESMTNSYEEMPENPVVAEAVSALQKPVSSSPPKTCADFQDNQSETESYDDVDEIKNEKHSYGDGTLSPDYLEVDPIQTQKEVDNGSESYDDVDQLHTDTEDYDDVGERQTVLHV